MAQEVGERAGRIPGKTNGGDKTETRRDGSDEQAGGALSAQAVRGERRVRRPAKDGSKRWWCACRVSGFGVGGADGTGSGFAGLGWMRCLSELLGDAESWSLLCDVGEVLFLPTVGRKCDCCACGVVVYGAVG